MVGVSAYSYPTVVAGAFQVMLAVVIVTLAAGAANPIAVGHAGVVKEMVFHIENDPPPQSVRT